MKNISAVTNTIKLLLIVTFILTAKLSHAQENSVIITEVQYDVAGAEAEAEWIEIYNPTESTVNIENWTITESNGDFYTFPSGTIMPSGSYLLLTNDTTSFQIDFPGVTPDIDMEGIGCYTTTECLRLNNSRSSGNFNADQLTLANDTDEIVDFVQWETTIANGWSISQTAGSTICRNTSVDTDGPEDWLSDCAETPGTGTYVPQIPEPEPETTSSSSRSGQRIRFACNDPEASNYSRFGRHYQPLCEYNEEQPTDTTFEPCSSDLIVTDNLKQGDRNGIRSGYNQGNIVSQVMLLQYHINRLLPEEYSITLDGIFGSQTYQGVQRLQTRLNTLIPGLNLMIDGMVGPNTKEAINNSC